MKNYKITLCSIALMLIIPIQIFAQNENRKPREIGVNVISILRGGNNAGFIYKIHDPAKNTALRFGCSGFSNNSAGNLFNQNYDNTPPDDISAFINTANSLGFTIGKEFHFYRKPGFRVYSFNDIGISATVSKNTTSSDYNYTTRSNGQRHLYDFERQSRTSRGLNLYDNFGIGMRYEWKQFAIFLETNVSANINSTFQRTKTTQYDYDSGSLTYLKQWSNTSNSPVSYNLNFNFSPVTILYFSYNW